MVGMVGMVGRGKKMPRVVGRGKKKPRVVRGRLSYLAFFSALSSALRPEAVILYWMARSSSTFRFVTYPFASRLFDPATPPFSFVDAPNSLLHPFLIPVLVVSSARVIGIGDEANTLSTLVSFVVSETGVALGALMSGEVVALSALGALTLFPSITLTITLASLSIFFMFVAMVVCSKLVRLFGCAFHCGPRLLLSTDLPYTYHYARLPK